MIDTKGTAGGAGPDTRLRRSDTCSLTSARGLALSWPCRLVVPIVTLRRRGHERFQLLASLCGSVDYRVISGVRDDAFEC